MTKNVFILNTGRCGSTTFIKACQHISNFTSAHESRAGKLGEARLNYPPNHIEADNRLSWFLGKLDHHYGNNAIYVHLKRDINNTAKSFVKRYDGGIIGAYRKNILINLESNADPFSVALDYCNTVNSNIEHFLKDKSYKIDFSLENAKEDFQVFYNLIGAEGDFEAALLEFESTYNSQEEIEEINKNKFHKICKKLSKLGQLPKKILK